MEENKVDELQEAVLTERRSLKYNAKDDELIRAIESAVQESKPLKEIADAVGKKNEIYWEKGTDIDYEKEVHSKHAKIVDNRIFMSVETILAMVTSRTPEPSIMGVPNNDIREKIIKALTVAYEVKYRIQLKLQSVIRHWFIYKIGVWKYRWDDGKFVTETVRADKMGFDPRATEKGNCEYMYERMEDKIGDLFKKFPDKKDELIKKFGKNKEKSKVGYMEFWGGGGEWVVWKLDKIILDKQKNPNFDYENDENNLFEEPEFPYLLLNVFNLGKNLYDDTSLIEQSISLQDSVNKRKNQISDLTDEQKKLIIASSNAISKEEFQKFINEFGMIGIWLDNGELGDIKIVEGKADAAAFNDLAQSIGEIDNIMGTHSTTRGERGQQETLGGRQLLTASDFGRIETIVLNIEQLMEDWYNAYLHMIKVYAIEGMEFDDGESEESITLNREDIPKGILVMVKKGSTLPVDKASRAEMAVKLAQFNFIDPLTLFEELGYGKAEQRKDALFEWLSLTGKIQMPEQPMGAGPGQPMGQPMAQQGNPELARLKEIITSDKFKKLSPKKQKPILEQARAIVEKVKQRQ